MTHISGCEWVCVGSSASWLYVCVSLVCQLPYCTARVAGTVRFVFFLIWDCTSSQSQTMKWSYRSVWIEMSRKKSQRTVCRYYTETRLLPTDSVCTLCFLGLLWLLNKCHLYVCSGVYSAKHCNPRSTAGSGCWMKLECQGEAASIVWGVWWWEWTKGRSVGQLMFFCGVFVVFVYALSHFKVFLLATQHKLCVWKTT